MEQVRKQLQSAILDVFKEHNLTPQQGLSELANTMLDITYNTGVYIGVEQPGEFVKDIIKQLYDQVTK